MSLLIEKLRHRTLDLLFPPRCISCQVELLELRPTVQLCSECQLELAEDRQAVCHRCGAIVPIYQPDRQSCSYCEARKTWFDATYSLGNYEGLRRDLVLRMKSDRSRLLATVFGKLLLDRFGKQLASGGLDGVVPIPANPWKRIVRGGNPPDAIGVVLARALNVPFLPRLLIKGGNVLPQHGLSQAGRFRNIRNGISLRLGYHLERSHLLLVDDVMTTGATAGEAARVLKRAGASRVTVAVVARTPPS